MKQGILPGMESLFKPAWQPLPHVLEKVKGYFQGFVAAGKAIFARRKYFARQLNMSVRTLSRYIAHLVAQGWLKTIKRTPRHAVRQVIEKSPSGTSLGTRIEVTSEVRSIEVLEKEPAAPESLRALRREIPTPLVIFRDIGRRFRAATKRKKYEDELAELCRKLEAEEPTTCPS